MAIATGLVTTTKSWKFPKCYTFVRPVYDDLVVPGHLIIVHGRPLWTSLSSMGDFCSRSILSSMNIFSSSEVILDLACSISSGQSFWTNWSWTNFPLPHQLPLCSKGRPGYCCDFNKISLFLWATCRKAVGWPVVSISFPKGTATCQFLSGERRFTDPVAGAYK